jgi:hypothetical protein
LQPPLRGRGRGVDAGRRLPGIGNSLVALAERGAGYVLRHFRQSSNAHPAIEQRPRCRHPSTFYLGADAYAQEALDTQRRMATGRGAYLLGGASSFWLQTRQWQHCHVATSVDCRAAVRSIEDYSSGTDAGRIAEAAGHHLEQRR